MTDKAACWNTIPVLLSCTAGEWPVCGLFTAITLKAGVSHALDRDWLKQAFIL